VTGTTTRGTPSDEGRTTPFPAPASVQQLATDPDPSVRRTAAAHPDISEALLQRLAGDPDPSVRRAAFEALGY
jgi:hypothetical protein